MTYQLIIRVEHVDLKEGEGISSCTFEPDTDTLYICIDTNRMNDDDTFAAIVADDVHDHLREAREAALQAPDVLQVAGKKAVAKVLLGEMEPLPIEEAIADAKMREIEASKIGKGYVTGIRESGPNPLHVIPDVVIQDNRIGTPIDGPPDRDGWVDPVAPPTRAYNVMIRRTIKAFVSSTFEAASAEEAVDMARNAPWTDEQRDYDLDDVGPIEWVHAERADIDDDEPSDHCDWEPSKLSPGALMEGLQKIRQLTVSTGDNPENHVEALRQIYELATNAINKAILGGE